MHIAIRTRPFEALAQDARLSKHAKPPGELMRAPSDLHQDWHEAVMIRKTLEWIVQYRGERGGPEVIQNVLALPERQADKSHHEGCAAHSHGWQLRDRASL